MGSLRLLLALWVVLTHGEAFFGRPVGYAWAAVQCFFIISGFYMSLILNEKYVGAGSIRLFFSNRFLRLFPLYWVVLVITLAVSGLAWTWSGVEVGTLKHYHAHSDVLGWHNLPALVLANLSIIGQNELLYLGFNPSTGHLFWTANFWEFEPHVWRFLFLPPAWSIELEVCFYALAPWIVRRSLRTVLIVIAASFAVRAGIYGVFHLTHDPWTYRFFPTELGVFLLGTVSYRFYRSPWLRALLPTLLPRILISALFVYTLAFPWLPVPGQIKAWPYYGLATVTIPFLFAITKNWRIDRYVGELSYPIYIVHYFIVGLCEVALPEALQWNRSLFAAAGSLTVAIALMTWISEPLEKWRQARVTNAGSDSREHTRRRVSQSAPSSIALVESASTAQSAAGEGT